MKRNLKALGLALVATFAMSAVAASAAQANFTQPQGQPAVFTGKEEGGPTKNFFQITGVNGPKTHCEETKYEGTLAAASSELTVTPHYTKCKATSGGITIDTNIDLNGCHYIFYVDTKNPLGGGTGSVEIVCPTGGQIEVTTSLCDTDIPPQKIVGGVTYKNVENGDVTVEARIVEKITYKETKTSIFGPCTNNHHTSDGSFTSDVLVEGFVDNGTHHWLTKDPDGSEHTLSTVTEGAALNIDVGL